VQHQASSKGDLSTVTLTQLNDIAKLLNGRPRQRLSWDVLEAATAEGLENAGSFDS